jgi:hypothetical protein
MLCCMLLLQDAFGAGMRLTTKYAYKAGSVCAWMRYPDPRSGTIVGMYLIDVHPKGECRRQVVPWVGHTTTSCSAKNSSCHNLHSISVSVQSTNAPALFMWQRSTHHQDCPPGMLASTLLLLGWRQVLLAPTPSGVRWTMSGWAPILTRWPPPCSSRARTSPTPSPTSCLR